MATIKRITTDLRIAARKKNATQSPLRQAIPMSSGGAVLDDYVLQASGKKIPKIMLIAGANGDRGINEFYDHYERFPCKPTHLSLFGPENKYGSREEMYNTILDQDIIHCSGGQSLTLLSILKGWGVVDVLREAYNKGTVCTGHSAGGNIWFETALSDYDPGKLSILKAAALIPAGFSPHHSGARHKAFIELLQKDEILPGYGVDEGVALHYINEKLVKIVTSNKGGRAYHYYKDNDGEICFKVEEGMHVGFDVERIHVLDEWENMQEAKRRLSRYKLQQIAARKEEVGEEVLDMDSD